jgi:hypothetical protein
MTIRELKKGDYFTLKLYKTEPNENQIWVRDYYDRTEKKYYAYNYADVNRERCFKGDKIVYKL